MDFSSAIIPMIKALENEISQYFYKNYVKWLSDNNVEIDKHKYKDKKFLYIEETKDKIRYKTEKELETKNNFTLGNLEDLIGLKKIKDIFIATDVTTTLFLKEGTTSYVVDKNILKYLQVILKENAFSYINYEEELTNYLANFVREIKTISDIYRNKAAHINVMNCVHAEVCGDYLVKTKKLIKQFLSKIK